MNREKYLHRAKSLAKSLMRIGIFLAITQTDFFATLLGFRTYEIRYGSWPEYLIYVGLEVGYTLTWGRKTLIADTRETRKKLLRGELSPPPFPVRMTFLLGSLAILIVATLDHFHPRTHSPAFLPLALALFGLFALIELNMLIFPNDTLLHDPHDELQNFFQSRSLKFGYTTAIATLTTLFLTTLYRPAWTPFAALLGLTIALIIPATTYHRMNRQADQPTP